MKAEDVIAARTELKLSRTKFGAALGVVRTTVMRWEKGEREVSRATELAIHGLLAAHRAGLSGRPDHSLKMTAGAPQ